MPVGLGDDGNAPTGILYGPANHGGAKRGVVDIGIA